MATTELDYFEYSSDANAQAAYVQDSNLATGGTITYAGGKTIHTFTSSGTFTPKTSVTVDYLIVGGGGSGGNTTAGGGGGGFVKTGTSAVTAQDYTITVGAGGAAQGTSSTAGNDGGNSSFNSITAGGGGGGGAYGTPNGVAGRNGVGGAGNAGGGGGGGVAENGTPGTPGTSTDAGGGGTAGNRGGSGSYPGAGGGGGASVQGSNYSSTTGGDGGTGISSSISGTSLYYGGGGGGAGYSGTGGTGGNGGGGAGATGATTGTAGTDGRGGGGGGSGSGNSGKGGDGVVVLAYTTPIQCFSEGTIKQQGSYSLKGIAQATTGLGKTLTRSVSPAIDLSGETKQYFDVRASRTGSNLTVGLRNNPYPVDSYDKLLIHGGGLDGNVPKVMTFVGTAQLDTAQKRFGSSSLLLDGNSDYLTTPDHADWNFGSGDFTIDAWIRTASGTTGDQTIFCQTVDATPADTKVTWFFYDNGNLRFLAYNSSGTLIVNVTKTCSLASNTWYHVAVVRNGNTFTLYRDGISVGTETDSDTLTDWAGVARIGAGINATSPGRYFNGWIDELRVSKGVARWTANFRPPTLSHLPDQYTALLLQFEGADAATATYDSCGGDSRNLGDDKAVTYNGTAAIDTAQSKFGGSSIRVNDGTNFIQCADSADWNFGTGNFTVEYWSRFSAHPGGTTSWGVYQWEDSSNRWFVAHDYTAAGCLMYFVDGGSVKGQYSCAHNPEDSTWHHYAFCRNGTAGLIFIDGVSQTLTETVAFSTNDVGDIAGVLSIGGVTTYGFDGWFEDVRISKGICRYTSNFTPPTRQFASHTVMETTPSLASADTWKNVEVDISSIADIDKSKIDQIQITVINADA